MLNLNPVPQKQSRADPLSFFSFIIHDLKPKTPRTLKKTPPGVSLSSTISITTKTISHNKKP